MDTQFKPLRIIAEFSLPDRASRDALETKITNFVGGQAPGSYSRNLYREDPEDSTTPFWFRMDVNLVITTIGDVATIRNTILANIDSFGTVLNYKFDFEEVLLTIGEQE